MARQAVPRSSKSKRETPPRPASPRPRFSWGGREWQVAGVLLVAWAVFTLAALVRITPGTLSDGWASALTRLFGWGAFAVAMGLGMAGFLLVLGGAAVWPRLIARRVVTSAHGRPRRARRGASPSPQRDR
jgi:hypothetical protein